jgi:hypothetical protein
LSDILADRKRFANARVSRILCLAAAPAPPCRRCRVHAFFLDFAKHRQFRPGFAEHWQNVSRTQRMDLPMLGNFHAILPMFGKMQNRAVQPRILPFSLLTLPFSLAAHVRRARLS